MVEQARLPLPEEGEELPRRFSPEEDAVVASLIERGLLQEEYVPFDDGNDYSFPLATSAGLLALELDALSKTTVDA